MPEPMNQQATDLTNLNNLYNLQSILTNINLNLGLIQEGTIGKILIVSNANLYQIAAEQYGDAMQWTVIANANGLTDPMIEPTLTYSVTIGTDNITIFEIDGVPLSPQSITFTINNIEYTYNVSTTDTLNTIATNISKFTPEAIAINNLIFYPNSDVVSSIVTIQRIINLVIPQQIGASNGGVLLF